MKNENQTRDLLIVKMELNALYDLVYGGGLDQLEIYPYSPKSYQIKLKANGPPEKISADLVSKFRIDKEYDKAKRFNEIEEAKKEIIKVFEKLRKHID